MDDPSGSPNKSPSKLPGGEGGNGQVSKPKNWVNFNDDERENKATNLGEDDNDEEGNREELNGHHHHPAVIEPSVEIHSPNSATTNHHNSNKTINHPLSGNGRSDGIVHAGHMQTVELQADRESNKSLNQYGNSVGSGVGVSTSFNSNGSRRNNTGFTNGDVIVSILPVNTKWPWVTPASFRPELVPEELMIPGLTLTVEEYVHAMEILTSDFRFNAYTICYKRLLAAWLSTAFFILLIILFSGVVGIQLFALGISWLIINAVAVFLCMYIKIKINQGLERCMAKVNRLLIKHKLIVGLDDRGRISCHKVHLCFIYFDPNDCVKRLEQLLESSGSDRQRVQNHLDARDVEIVISGAQNTTRIPKKQGDVIFLRYVQRWAKAFLRELAIGKDKTLHCPKQMCPCQFINELLQEKRITGGLGAWVFCRNLADADPNTFSLH